MGRPKPSTRNLPGKKFIFGKPEFRDPEDAGQGKLSTAPLIVVLFVK